MTISPELQEKYENLLSFIRKKQSAAVAFSGGVDSSLLCRAAREALGDGALAVTVVSPLLPKSELDDARRIAALTGIEHILLERPDIESAVAANPPDRCYHCKKNEFAAIIACAKSRGAAAIFDGSNVDDPADYRPGLKALKELGVESPLREAGLSKAEIRELSREAGLPTWDKPAFACLASRIPYGQTIDAKQLAAVEAAETVLARAGFRQVRVRVHGDIARIEVAREERRKFFDVPLWDRLASEIKALGFRYVAAELSGYVTGSLNRELPAFAKDEIFEEEKNENTAL
ncbi:MAG: ATP-dependent sacrificial sulfur transferase LarE [Treponema sp.]|jgi:uncharacterized protein|nr:ATP-dependent sacrificial sulfur transferase LarE [Treponema sp.]